METILCKDTIAFVIGKKDIEGRFDVNYYKPKYREIIKKLKKSPFETKRLGDIASFSTERWRKPKSGVFKYIEISDIDTFSGQIVQGKELDVKDAPSRAQMVVRENDIIVSTTRPYRGAVALVTNDFNNCICSTGFAVIRDLKTRINRNYLLHLLHSNLGLKQMEQRMTGGNYPAITPSELLRIWIPLPPTEIQDKIAWIMDDALRKKEESEKKSEILLNSTDDYLLQELGIVLPLFEEKSLLSFDIGAKFLRNERWDVEYWKSAYRGVEKAIGDGKYQTIVFDRLIEKIVNGLDYRNFSETGTGYLRVGNIKPFEVDQTDIKYVPIELSEVDKDILLETNDILLTRKGTFGVATIVSGEVRQNIISSEIFRLVLRKDIEMNVYYVISVLNSIIGKNQFSRKSIGAIMGSLSQKAVRSLLIPFPPKPIQDKIANEVRSRIEKAKELKDVARKVLENAQSKIERIILSKENT
jgi:type I restriction enzyme M protein